MRKLLAWVLDPDRDDEGDESAKIIPTVAEIAASTGVATIFYLATRILDIFYAPSELIYTIAGFVLPFAISLAGFLLIKNFNSRRYVLLVGWIFRLFGVHLIFLIALSLIVANSLKPYYEEKARYEEFQEDLAEGVETTEEALVKPSLPEFAKFRYSLAGAGILALTLVSLAVGTKTPQTAQPQQLPSRLGPRSSAVKRFFRLLKRCWISLFNRIGSLDRFRFFRGLRISWSYFLIYIIFISLAFLSGILTQTGSWWIDLQTPPQYGGIED